MRQRNLACKYCANMPMRRMHQVETQLLRTSDDEWHSGLMIRNIQFTFIVHTERFTEF